MGRWLDLQEMGKVKLAINVYVFLKQFSLTIIMQTSILHIHKNT